MGSKGNEMKVELLHNTPLWIASTAIRKCWASEGKSDTNKAWVHVDGYECGEKDKELIFRVGNKNKHSSTLEHLVYTFDIDGISRACLQEVARHRHASMSVKSTRYTLKELKEANPSDYMSFLVHINDRCNLINMEQLDIVRDKLNEGISNDIVKYCLPEAYKTSLVWTINARSLQNFLELRTSKSALWEIRDLAYEVYDNLPEEHKYLFEEYLYKEEK